MTVYVDETLDWTLIAKARGLRHTHWCHLTADTEAELHAFAARLGLRRSWYQPNAAGGVGWHYDITPPKRAQAVRLGAREVDYRFMAELMDRRRTARTTDPETEHWPMTGPEHYREAERLLKSTRDTLGGPAAEALLTAKAQAHATLALAAATAHQPSTLPVNRAEWKDWAAAALTDYKPTT